MSTSWTADQEKRPEESPFWNSSLRSPVLRQYSGSSLPAPAHISTPPQRAATIDSLASFAFSSSTSAPLEIPPKDEEKYNAFFDKIDVNRAGNVPGSQLVEFFNKSRLPEADLAHIWDIADAQHRGQLNRKEFIIAMHLIHMRMTGKTIPKTLPLSLQPTASAPVSPNMSQAAYNASNQAYVSLPFPQQQHKSQVQQPQQMPRKDADLLGDFGNEQWEKDTNQVNLLQNQISSLKLDTDNMQRQKLDAGQAMERLAKQKQELQAHMAQVKKVYESEAKDLKDIQELLKQEQNTWTQAQNEFQAAQQRLQATQNEIDQARQTIERGRIESDRLRHQVQEIQGETARLVSELDNLRDQVKQQSTKLDISRRQITASTQDRDQARRDLNDYKDVPGFSQVKQTDHLSAKSSETSPVSPAASLPITSFDAAFGDLFADIPAAPRPPPPTSQSRHHHRPTGDHDSPQSPAKQLRTPPPPPQQAQAVPEPSVEPTPFETEPIKNEEEDDFEKFFSTQLEPAKVLHSDMNQPSSAASSDNESVSKQTDNWASSFGGFNFPEPSTTKKTASDDWDAIFGGPSLSQNDPSRANDNLTKDFENAPASPAVPSAKEEKAATKRKVNTGEDGVDELVKMGFSRSNAQEALERYDGDLDKATNFLLDQSANSK